LIPLCSAQDREQFGSNEDFDAARDPGLDARAMATDGKGTGMVGYNVQAVVDAKHHLIIAHEVTNVGHDRSQLAKPSRSIAECHTPRYVEAHLFGQPSRPRSEDRENERATEIARTMVDGSRGLPHHSTVRRSCPFLPLPGNPDEKSG
jgi:hypothetical protein